MKENKDILIRIRSDTRSRDHLLQYLEEGISNTFGMKAPHVDVVEHDEEFYDRLGLPNGDGDPDRYKSVDFRVVSSEPEYTVAAIRYAHELPWDTGFSDEMGAHEFVTEAVRNLERVVDNIYSDYLEGRLDPKKEPYKVGF